jgi:hypothetical protein
MNDEYTTMTKKKILIDTGNSKIVTKGKASSVSKFPEKAGFFTIELCARHNCPLNKGVL